MISSILFLAAISSTQSQEIAYKISDIDDDAKISSATKVDTNKTSEKSVCDKKYLFAAEIGAISTLGYFFGAVIAIVPALLASLIVSKIVNDLNVRADPKTRFVI